MISLLNATTLVVAGALAVVLVGVRRSAGPDLAGYVRILCHPVVLVSLAVLAIGHVGTRTVLGLVAKGDFMGEVVAAESWARGHGLYTPELASDAGAVLARSPDGIAGAVAALLPDAAHDHLASAGRGRIVAQAHPPPLLGGLALAVSGLGANGAFLLLTAATAVAAAWSARMLVLGCGIDRTLVPLAMVLVVGWQPVLATVRDGQVSVLLAALCVAAWNRIRTGDARSGGALLGLAASLKFYPGVLALSLTGRSLPAMASAMASALVVCAATTLVVGFEGWTDFVATGAAAVAGHRTTFANVSVLGWLERLLPTPLATAEWVVSSAVLVALTATSVRRDVACHPASFDRSFALCCCLGVALPPVAWHHYASLLLQPLAFAWARYPRSSGLGQLVLITITLVLSLPVTDATGGGITPGLFPSLGLLFSPTAAVIALWVCVLRIDVRVPAPPACIT